MERTLFLQVSALLTGFAVIELEGTGMVDDYHDAVIQRTESSLLDGFFATAANILSMPAAKQDDAVTNSLMTNPAYAGMAQRIVLMWYEGLWVVSGSSEVINAQAYVQSLMWPAAGTHPSGAKQGGFGSWSRVPEI